METLPVGEYELEVVGITDKPSTIKEGLVITTIEMDVLPERQYKIYKSVSEAAPYHLTYLISKLWPWYGKRLGKSIFRFDTRKLIGRKARFNIKHETYAGRTIAVIDMKKEMGWK